MKFSVVMPCWNEGPALAHSLKRLREISDNSALEIVVVDGGSADATAAAARPWADKVLVLDKPNRGAQLHAGARAASGDLLFFLHADTQPPQRWQACLEKYWLTRHGSPPAATVFSVDYGGPLAYRAIAAAQNLRARWFQVGYGDQGLCTTAETYARSGGYPEIPLMEDVEFCRRLRGLGAIALLPEPIWPSARRLRARGALRNALFNHWVALRYKMGADPQELWREYYGRRAEA